jgi:hypothetical protein
MRSEGNSFGEAVVDNVFELLPTAYCPLPGRFFPGVGK